jgi:hypothetical protein
METAKAFIIVTWFLVKCAGVAVFTVGAYTTVTWLRKNISFFTYKEEAVDTTDNYEWIQSNYG